MAHSPPFVDGDGRSVDLEQIGREAIPLATLAILFGFLALVPFAVAFVGILPAVFLLLAQFVLLLGAGIVLLYIVARGIQLAERETD